MVQVELASWQEFLSRITGVLQDARDKKANSEMYVSEPLFRGQCDASWKLTTTLERYVDHAYTTRDYHHILLSVKPAIESLTSRSWDIGEFDDDFVRNPLKHPLGYEFMIYARHHGLPSPLLDWTRSPYVAAFFAFRSKIPPSSGHVAIYYYMEYYAEGKIGSPTLSTIAGLGPYVVTHRRHYNQQCEYTICRKRVDQIYTYSSHEEAIKRRDGSQDIVAKYLIPFSERRKALEYLDMVNINAYSLFEGEDALMETLAYREIEKPLR